MKIINIRKQYILNQKYLNEINYFKENRLIWINSKFTHIKYLNVRKYLRTFLKKDYIEYYIIVNHHVNNLIEVRKQLDGLYIFISFEMVKNSLSFYSYEIKEKLLKSY